MWTMDYHDFVGEVQNRLELPGTDEAVRAIRAVPTTLGERIQEGEASNLAGPLPTEIDRYLIEAESGQQFGFDEFVSRVPERARLDEDGDGQAGAVYYVRDVLALLADVVPGEVFEEVRENVPDDEGFEQFFELVGVDEAFEETPNRGN